MVKQGKIIVLDGLDGCGKSTQFAALGKLLTEQGETVKPISFPMYDKPSAALVKMYLRGDFSDTPDGVNAYAASSFYAVDRYASYKLDWEKNYPAGELILASRYKLGLPQPNLVLFLSLPLELSQKLLAKRYDGDASKKDIHEADLAYLEQCDRAARYAGEKLGWQFVEVSDGRQLYPAEQIRDELYRRIQEAFAC